LVLKIFSIAELSFIKHSNFITAIDDFKGDFSGFYNI